MGVNAAVMSASSDIQVSLSPLLNGLPVATCVFSAADELVAYNTAAQKLFSLIPESKNRLESGLYQITGGEPGVAGGLCSLQLHDGSIVSVIITQQVLPAVAGEGSYTIKYYQPQSQTVSSLTQHLNNLPFALIEWENDKVVSWSARAERMFGWSSAEALGKSLAMLNMTAADDALVTEGQKKIDEEHSPFNRRLQRNGTKSGGFIYCIWYNSALRTQDSLVGRVLTLVEEVTDKLIKEEQLRLGQAQLDAISHRLRSIISHAQVAMAVYTGYELELTHINHQMLHVLQKDERILGQTLLQFLPEIEGQPFPRLLRNVLRTGETYNEEEGLVMLRRNGRLEAAYFDYSYAALPGPDGKPESIIVTATEVTERVLAQRALREKEEEVTLAYNNISTGLFLLQIRNGEPYFASVNKTLLAWSGKSAEELIGKNCREVMPLPLTSPMVLHLRRVLETGKRAQWSEEWLVHDGTTRSVNVTLVPILNAAGRSYKVAGSIHDETQLKRQAVELEQLNGELHRLTRHQQQVREDERRSIAREVHDELGQLLTALKIELFSARQNVLQDAPLAHKKLGEALEVMDATISTVRRVVAELHPMVLHDLGLIEALRWQVQQFSQKTGLSVHFHHHKDLIEPSTKTGLSLFRICQEALTNVWRHAQARKVDVYLGLENEQLKLRIKDDGKGFDPGQKSTGTFGLIGMKERAATCNGTIQIVSSPGLGTTIVTIVPQKEPMHE